MLTSTGRTASFGTSTPVPPWKQVVTAAKLVRGVLKTLGLESWVKTTGGHGLHVVAPIKPARDWSECLEFARARIASASFRRGESSAGWSKTGFRVLAAGNEPDFRTIADFRKRHLAALQGFFEQVLRLARELGAPRVGRVALDGSKVKANASKHKAMSYDRMREKQQQLREEVTALLAQAEAADAAEDTEYGANRRGDELPAELQRRESRLTRIREARRSWRPVRKKRPPRLGRRPTRSNRSRKPNTTLVIMLQRVFSAFGDKVLPEALCRLVHLSPADGHCDQFLSRCAWAMTKQQRPFVRAERGDRFFVGRADNARARDPFGGHCRLARRKGAAALSAHTHLLGGCDAEPIRHEPEVVSADDDCGANHRGANHEERWKLCHEHLLRTDYTRA